MIHIPLTSTEHLSALSTRSFGSDEEPVALMPCDCGGRVRLDGTCTWACEMDAIPAAPAVPREMRITVRPGRAA